MTQKFILIALFILVPSFAWAKESGKMESSHYEIYGPEEKAGDVSFYLEKFYGELRKLYPFEPPRSAKLSIYLMASEKEVDQKRGSAESLSCFNPNAFLTSDNHLVISCKPARWLFYSSLFHYACHQYFRRSLKLPIWMEEGLSEYFGGTIINFHLKSMDLGLPRYRYFPELKKAMKENKLPILEEFLDYSLSRFYESSSKELNVAFSWILIHYMIEKQKKTLQSIFLFVRSQKPLYYNQILGGFTAFMSGVKRHTQEVLDRLNEKDYQESLDLFKQKKYFDAIGVLSRILRLNPYHTNARYVRALCHYEKNNFPGALKDLEFLIQIGLDQSPPHYYWALIQLKQGYRPQAIEALEKANKLNPEDKKVAELLKSLKK